MAAGQEHRRISERAEKAEQKLSKEIYDYDAWQTLLHESQHRDADARAVFGRFVTVFPTSVRCW